jgi:hypothetical protein
MHTVDEFNLKFTSRRGWKAELRRHGRMIGVIPVTWTKGRSVRDGEIFQKVYFRPSNAAEMENYRVSGKPFIIAVALAKDYSTLPHVFKSFQTIFEVIATGAISEDSIETKVLRRLSADQPVEQP